MRKEGLVPGGVSFRSYYVNLYNRSIHHLALALLESVLATYTMLLAVYNIVYWSRRPLYVMTPHACTNLHKFPHCFRVFALILTVLF